MSETNCDRVNAILGDYEALQHELKKLLLSNPDLYLLNRVAVEMDWEQTRTLKTAVVWLAARLADAHEQMVKLHQSQPLIIEVGGPCPG